MLKGNYAWLEEGAIVPDADGSAPPAPGARAAGTPSERDPLSGTRVATQVGAGA